MHSEIPSLLVVSMLMYSFFQFVEAPLQYKLALSSLDSYRCAFHPDEHILFLGSGCEDDLYLHMVIASFLQQGRKHIALVDGGYKGAFSLYQ